MAEACGELHYEMETDETIFLLLDNFYLFPFGSFFPPLTFSSFLSLGLPC